MVLTDMDKIIIIEVYIWLFEYYKQAFSVNSTLVYSKI